MGRRAPWTPDEVENIKLWQSRLDTHPLTCPYHSEQPLAIVQRAVLCPMPTCSYEQTWVPSAMTYPPLAPATSRKDAP